jgi:hypothetical protein
MRIARTKFTSLVEFAVKQLPWASSRDPLHPRNNDMTMPTPQRECEFQWIIDWELEASILRLCPGHPPIPLVQMLNMDTTDGSVEVLLSEDAANHLSDPAAAFLVALVGIGLRVTFTRTNGTQRHYLCISLNGAPMASATTACLTPGEPRDPPSSQRN